MENDLISRSALINEMESHIYWGDSVIGLLEVAKNAPAVEAEPVRHSHWVKCAGERFAPIGAYAYCYLCHFYDSEPYNWCHGCGAYMRSDIDGK